jgi:ABC-type Fe3+/spermidine/putrescine transport system ATPase subunit
MAEVAPVNVHSSFSPAIKPGVPLLEVDNLSKSFGGLVVIHRLSFSLEEGETLGIIGPNGSGKTTLFNLMTGFLKADRGKISFSGNEITTGGFVYLSAWDRGHSSSPGVFKIDASGE